MNERITIPEGTAFNAIGQPVRRKEDQRLLTGKGRFTDDFSLDGQTYAAMVRSPHAHARIKRIDTAKAKAMPGVLGVFTGADVRADGLGPLPHSADAVDQVRHEARPAGGREPVHRAERADARRQDPSRRRSRGDGGGANPRAGDGRRRGGGGRIRGAAVRPAFRRRAEARRAGGLGRSGRQRTDRHMVRRQDQDRRRVRRGRPCGEEGIQHRPRHRGDDGAALRARPLRSGDAALHALCRRRRRGEAQAGAGRCTRRAARQGARAVVRRRRQFRRAQPALRGVRAGDVGLEEGRPPGEIHRNALGSLPHRLSGPRPAHPRGAGASQGRQDPGDARRQHQQRWRAVRVAVAAQQGRGADHRLL